LGQKVKDAEEIISWIGSQAVISYTPEGGTGPGVGSYIPQGNSPYDHFSNCNIYTEKMQHILDRKC
jgi:hypothetical protein